MGRWEATRAAMVAGLLVATTITSSYAQQPSGPPPSPDAPPPTDQAPMVFDIAPGVTAEALAFAGGSSTPVLYRLRLAAGTTYAFVPDPSVALAVVEMGSVTITSDTDLVVVDPASGDGPSEIQAGTPVEVAPGARIVLPEGAGGQLIAGQTDDVSLVVASVPTAMLQPSTTPTPASSPAAGIVSAGSGGTATPCILEYQRADSMWAAYGEPDGILPTETIRLAPGQRTVFVTDWANEKRVNNGSTYYGSHLRRTANMGSRPVVVRIKELSAITYRWTLDPLTKNKWRADLMEVSCPL